MDGVGGVYIVFVVIVAALFNLLFLTLMLRVICLRFASEDELAARAAQASERAGPPCTLQRVTPVIVLQPGDEIAYAKKLGSGCAGKGGSEKGDVETGDVSKEAARAHQESAVRAADAARGGRGIAPLPAERQFWVTTLPAPLNVRL